MIKKSLTSLISLVLIISHTQNSMCRWFYSDTPKTAKTKCYVHKEEIKEYLFSSNGTLHIENENNNSSNSNNFFGNIINNGSVTINGKTYTGKNIKVINNRVIIDGEEQNNVDAEPNNITIEGHDKDILELLMETKSNDGDLECVSSDLKIDEKNAFIKTVYKTKDCQASRSYTLKIPKKTFIKLLLTTKGSITAENIDGTIEKTSSVSGDINIRNIDGKVTVKNVSGTNTLQNIKNDVLVNSISGDNTLNDITGNVLANSISGDNTIEDIIGNTSTNSVSGDNSLNNIKGNATVNSVAGNNTLTSIEKEIDVTTVSGSITVKLGNNSDATIEASTLSGQCKSDVAVNGTQENKNIKGTIGKGGPLKKLKTTSGKIHIKK